MNTSDDSNAREMIGQLRATWLDAMARGDVEAVKTMLTDDYEVWANSTPPLVGPEATVAAMRAALTRVRVFQSFEPVELIVSGDWAFERGIETLVVTPIDGGTSQRLSQRAMLILRRERDGQWRYARGMTNALPPTESAPNWACGARSRRMVAHVASGATLGICLPSIISFRTIVRGPLKSRGNSRVSS